MRFTRTLLALTVIVGLLQSQVAAQQQAAASASATSTQSPAPAPSSVSTLPFKLGSTRLGHTKNVLFVFAVGGSDASLRARFVTGLTLELQKMQEYYHSEATQFVPETAWDVGDFVSACKGNHDAAADANLVSGALIVAIQESSNFTDRGTIKTYKHTVADANLSYASCVEGRKVAKSQPHDGAPGKPPAKNMSSKALLANAAIPDCAAALSSKQSSAPTSTATGDSAEAKRTASLTSCQYIVTSFERNKVKRLTSTWSVASPMPSPSPSSYITWQSDIAEGDGHYFVYTPFTLLSGLLIGVSLYTLLAATHTSSSSAITTYPTPVPWNPPPRNGYVSSQTQGYATGSNVNGLSAFVPAYLGQQINYDQYLVNMNTSDAQTLAAIGKIIRIFVLDSHFMQCPGDAWQTMDEPVTRAPLVPLSPDTMCYKILQAEEPSGAPIPHNSSP
jgi:hypothetical protein